MLSVLRAESKIKLPKKIIDNIGILEGDKLDIIEKNGIIYIIPVTVYPGKYLKLVKQEINKIKKNIISGKQPVFDTVDDMFAKLETEK